MGIIMHEGNNKNRWRENDFCLIVHNHWKQTVPQLQWEKVINFVCTHGNMLVHKTQNKKTLDF